MSLIPAFTAMMLEGTTITTCFENNDCSLCGVMPAANPGDWSYVQCPVEEIATEVRIQNPNRPLGFCEVEIYAKMG